MSRENGEPFPLSEQAHRPGAPGQLAEVLVFLFLIVPSMILGFFAIRQTTIGFVIMAADTIFRDAALVALIVLFLRKNREPLASIGWRGEDVGREVFIGVVLFPAVFLLTGLLGSILQEIGLTAPSEPPPSFLVPYDPLRMGLALVLVTVVALAEETLFRGYLLLRFINLGLGRVGAVVLSSVVFSLGHGYEGSAGVLTVGVTGAVLATVYLWRRSLVAPVVIHFLQNLAAFLLLPMRTPP
jgi:membrane protease YdiL (CAAX protease family)